LSLFEKETGTVAWIRRAVKEGDVFCDVGANVGMYSLLAAMRVGRSGRVYAFEPHVVNCASLLANVALNRLVDRIDVFSAPLHASNGIADFNYQSLIPGSAMSQVGSTVDGEGTAFTPLAVERKLATTLDRLVREETLRPPTHIKIDVDGNEPLVLRGMSELLRGDRAPVSVQVEMNLEPRSILEFMSEAGYDYLGRHDTANGKRRIAGGARPEEVAHNAIFWNSASSRRPEGLGEML
jgi:FkbM family methyltransferase